MVWKADDLVRAHARFGTASEIIEQCRAVYQAPIELLADRGGSAVGVEVLDHPMTRGHLAEVLGGLCDYDESALVSLTGVAADPAGVEGIPVRIASSPSAGSVLAPAVRRVTSVLGRYEGPVARPVVLIRTDAAFPVAQVRLRQGVELVCRLARELALDLLPHVTLFAVLSGPSAGRLGSASAREYPGLVLLPEPASALEAAEAFVHEGAHQKFFDLAITRTILGVDHHTAPGFAPSWAPTDRAPWRVRQTFAALHAYCCLAAFATALGDELAPVAPSLLPMAAARAEEIGEWLRRHPELLGPDGAVLLTGLLGGPSVAVPDAVAWSPVPACGMPLVRRVGERTLIASSDRPPRLWWLTEQPSGVSTGLV